ncbi:terpene synthase family protein [Mycobacteroides chelonae]
MVDNFDINLSGAYVLLPSFEHCLPARCHPDAGVVIEQSHKWCRHSLTGLLPAEGFAAILKEQASLWTAYVLPTASYDFILAAAQFTEYLSILDNALVDRHRLGSDPEYAGDLKAAIDVLFADGCYDHSLVNAELVAWFSPLADCLHTIRQYLTPSTWTRFGAEVERFFIGCVEEVVYRNSAAVYSYSEYLRMRRNSVGMGMYFALGEALVCPTASAHYGAIGKQYHDRLLAVALDHIALANDLFSFRAEADANDPVNAVATLVLSEQLTVQDAVDRVGIEVQNNENAFRKILHQTRCDLGETDPVSAYGELLWHMMCGNVDWSFRTTRYNGERHQWNGHYPRVIQFDNGSTRFTQETYTSLLSENLV